MIVYIHEKEEVQYFIVKQFCLFQLLVAFHTMLIPTKSFFLNRIIQKTVELSDPHDHDSSEILVDRDKKDNNNCEINCSTPLHGDTASPNIFNGVKVLKAVTPKLSAATDPFFIDMESPTKQKPVVKSGIQNLRER